MPLDPDDATPLDRLQGPTTNAGADQDAALRAHIRAVETDPLRRAPTQVLIGFGAQLGWLALALLLLNITWARGVRQYSAVGA